MAGIVIKAFADNGCAIVVINNDPMAVGLNAFTRGAYMDITAGPANAPETLTCENVRLNPGEEERFNLTEFIRVQHERTGGDHMSFKVRAKPAGYSDAGVAEFVATFDPDGNIFAIVPYTPVRVDAAL